MACRNSVTFLKLAPRSAFLDMMPNQISTWFNPISDIEKRGRFAARAVGIGIDA
jgi:hypothetical protein